MILSTVFAGKVGCAVSPLPEEFYANFGGAPITDDSPDHAASYIPQWLFVRDCTSPHCPKSPGCD